MTRTNELEVYNLVFPDYVKQFSIAGYQFKRVRYYENAVGKLQHLGKKVGGEISLPESTGEHSITAKVILPKEESSAFLPWASKNASGIDDLMVLFSIFTKREVFLARSEEDNGSNDDCDENEGIEKIEKKPHRIVKEQLHRRAILADPRVYSGGGILRCSLTRDIRLDKSGYYRNVGFAKSIAGIYKEICSEQWQKLYKGGYYLLLARASFRRQLLEARFTQSWTIWEHLFSILNQDWMSPGQIEKVSSSEKISFLLVRYGIKESINAKTRSKIDLLINIRNRLIHKGQFPDRTDVHDDALLFIELTEVLVAKTLGLKPSDVQNTITKFEKFIAPSEKKQAQAASEKV